MLQTSIQFDPKEKYCHPGTAISQENQNVPPLPLTLVLQGGGGATTPLNVFMNHEAVIKGALDNYNIYFFISNSIEDFKSNQYRNFQPILPMRFHFMRYFVNSIISRVSHGLLYCVFIEVDFEK